MSLKNIFRIQEWASFTIKLHKRSKIEAVIFLIIQFIWLAIPISIESKKYNSQFLNSNIYYTLEKFFENQNQQIILYITLSINTFLIFFPIIDSIDYSFFKCSSYYFKKLFSVIFLSHEYILLLPSINSSLATLHNYPYFPSYVNVVFCFLIGICSLFIDFDYSILRGSKLKDFLQRGFYLKIQIGKVILYVLFFVLQNMQNIKVNSWIGLSTNLDFNTYELKSVYKDKISHCDLDSDKILFLIQNMLDQIRINYVQYSSSHSSLFLEELSNIHFINCQNYPYCFCQQK
ncbi:hypothetical protein ABPG74_015351, partial [Tetrahymena malaccensis]